MSERERFNWAREDILAYLRRQPREALQRIIDGDGWTTHCHIRVGGARCLLGHIHDYSRNHDRDPYTVLDVNFVGERYTAFGQTAGRAFDTLGDHDLEGAVAWVKGEAARLLEERVE